MYKITLHVQNDFFFNRLQSLTKMPHFNSMTIKNTELCTRWHR